MRSVVTLAEQQDSFLLEQSMLVNAIAGTGLSPEVLQHLTAKLNATWPAMATRLRSAAVPIASRSGDITSVTSLRHRQLQCHHPALRLFPLASQKGSSTKAAMSMALATALCRINNREMTR